MSFFLRATAKSEQMLWQWDRNSNPNRSPALPALLDITQRRRGRGVGRSSYPLLFFPISFLFRFFLFVVNQMSIESTFHSVAAWLIPAARHPMRPPSLWKKYHSTTTQSRPLPPYGLSRPALLLSQCLFADLMLFPALPTHFFRQRFSFCGVCSICATVCHAESQEIYRFGIRWACKCMIFAGGGRVEWNLMRSELCEYLD